MNFTNNIYNQIIKGSIWKKILFILVIILVCLITIRVTTPHKEGFVQLTKFQQFSNTNDIYDNFYADVYDEIYHSELLCDNVYSKIKEIAKPTQTSRLLDIGIGTGCLMQEFTKGNIPIEGIDTSQAMIKKAKEKNNLLKIKHGDALDSFNYNEDDFTHIICFYFTIYYIQDKHMFLQNIYNWLEPGGILILHLVNRNKFDPIVPAGNPLLFVSPQKYAKKRITNSVIKFKDFQYKSNFKLEAENDKAFFYEEFRDDVTGKVRKHEHQLYMPPQSTILGIAQDIGFNVFKKYDMIELHYEYQYLYFLQKPNDY